jgi:NAD(P)-dependent dehydrogenase (short-subunit alcohol dehydrogenase family)
MSKIIVVVGFGPGNSTAVAEKFGAAGFRVAIVGRDAERLAAGVAALKARGVTAAAFTGNAADPDSIRATIRRIRAELGPIAVVHWNASGGADVGDLLVADSSEVRGVFDVAVIGLLAAVREALPDLKNAGDGALLITNGGFGDASPDTDAFVTRIHAVGIGLANAAKNKLAGLLAERLRNEGVYVGEVVIYGTVKGTPTGREDSIDPSRVADAFWSLYQARGDARATIT